MVTDAARSPTARVAAAYRTIAEADRPEIWITLRQQTDVFADAAAVERRLAAGEPLPLAGMLVAVKDNIDVAGLPTTAACPEFAYLPATTAVAVQRLCAAGAVVLGKANLDQFATGLAGTRSPYGAVRNSRYPQLVAGGSSSGPAVAVALGIADIGVGTDTAGSVRVPAALNGIAGIKPTLGIIPTHGVVPACPSFDAVSVLAADVARAAAAVAVMAGPDSRDPRSRAWPSDVRFAAPGVPRLAIPEDANLSALSPAYADAFTRTVTHATRAGMRVEAVDISLLLDAALLLYDGAFVAERYAAVGAFLDSHPAGADPVVAQIITSARSVSGAAFAADLNALALARAGAGKLLAGFDGLLLPTTTEHPSLADVRADPHTVVRRMGAYTNFCNLLDMAAVAFPGEPTTGGAPFGAMVVVPAFGDQVAVDIAARIGGTPSGAVAAIGCDLAVFGAHMRGHPMHGQLDGLGARYLGPVSTASAYRLLAVAGTTPTAGVVRAAAGAGREIQGELFRVSEVALSRLLSGLPAQLGLAGVELDDGRSVVAVVAADHAAGSAADITGYRHWARYLEATGGEQP
ncbi:allophanate hydrolase [Mycobacterium parmense]|uniref:Allophanate hydrolase n=1 Tax=Mycobacterium parmense TaxID=185642 RepID=A0A7I7YQG7_9MYCO|nr:allophanate hydrolase [Mycobacterium parmense]MCV7353440.1 allophanate hydrolase [Mycobacterium parmense]ORW51539.1 allophanate hydrolase [Mycobacterium parmense]BBZ44000.1 allophanate hydrolase [Mycobacterium parmense]